MTWGRKYGLYAAVTLLIPAIAAALWWWYWPRTRLSRAEQELAANHLVRAEELLRQVLREDPKQAHAEILYARVLRRLGRPEDAYRALSRLLDLGFAQDLEALREYGLLTADQNFSLAEGALQRVLKERPGDIEVLQALARGYVRGLRWVEAEGLYTQWLQAEPGRLDLLFKRGTVRREAEHYNSALDDFRLVLSRAPQHFQARLYLADCLMRLTRMEEAKPELLTCQGLRPDRPEPFVGLAACAVDKEEWQEAQSQLEQALRRDSSSLLALKEQGSLYLRRDRTEAAIRTYSTLVALYPQDKEVHLKLSMALRRSGDLKGADKQQALYEKLEQEEEKLNPGVHGMH